MAHNKVNHQGNFSSEDVVYAISDAACIRVADRMQAAV